MEEIKLDRRVRKTKKAIRNAFALLLSEKNINDITVKDIAEKADINRKTFYNYYSGVYQVVDEIENEILDTFEEAVKDVDVRSVINNPYIIFDKLNVIINTDLDFYTHIIQMDKNISLATKLISLLKTKTMATLKSQIDFADDGVLDIAVDFAMSGMIAVFQHWSRSDKTKTLEEISHTLGLIFSEGLNGIISK